MLRTAFSVRHDPHRAALRRSITLVSQRVADLGTLPTASPPAAQPGSLTLGLLRETYDKWERRAPLTPDQCRAFLREHPTCTVVVQPSSHRIFSNTQYERAGAVVREDLHDAHVIMGVKRPQSMVHLPSDNHRTYMFFSHVIKGQPENMVRPATLRHGWMRHQKGWRRRMELVDVRMVCSSLTP